WHGDGQPRIDRKRRLWRSGFALVVFSLVVSADICARAIPAGASVSQPGAHVRAPSSAANLSGVQPSSAPFVVALPRLASCSRSTSTSGYHVQSFLVDESSGPDPSTYRYQALGPTLGLPLWTLSSAYANVNTNVDGTIPVPPVFSWRHYYRFYSRGGTSGAGGLHAGTWHLGIACSDASNGTDRFWDVPLRISDSSSDPHGFVWEPLSV